MALAVLRSRALAGLAAPEVTVEVHLAAGLPSFTLVGLPDTEVKEARDRVRAAIVNSQLTFPLGRITVNLAPADLRKEGPGFDLPIALAMLAASDQLDPRRLEEFVVVGELALDGSLRSVRGALPVAWRLRQGRRRRLIVPAANATEAALVGGVEVYPVARLREAVDFLNGVTPIHPYRVDTQALFARSGDQYAVDLSDVRGQAHA